MGKGWKWAIVLLAAVFITNFAVSPVIAQKMGADDGGYFRAKQEMKKRHQLEMKEIRERHQQEMKSLQEHYHHRGDDKGQEKGKPEVEKEKEKGKIAPADAGKEKRKEQGGGKGGKKMAP